MGRFVFWRNWLLVVSVLIAVFGIAFAFLSHTAVFEALFGEAVDRSFALSGAEDVAVRRFQQWIYGVLGATVAGWGAVLAFIAYSPFARRERWAWNGVAAGMAVWFLPDTAISWYFGVWINVAFNTLVLVAVMLPLVATRRDFGAPVR